MYEKLRGQSMKRKKNKIAILLIIMNSLSLMAGSYFELLDPEHYAKLITISMIDNLNLPSCEKLKSYFKNKPNKALAEIRKSFNRVEKIGEELEAYLLKYKPEDTTYNIHFVRTVKNCLLNEQFFQGIILEMESGDYRIPDHDYGMLRYLRSAFPRQFYDEKLILFLILQIKERNSPSEIFEHELEETVFSIVGSRSDIEPKYYDYTVRRLLEIYNFEQQFFIALHELLSQQGIVNKNLLYFNWLINLLVKFDIMHNKYAFSIVKKFVNNNYHFLVEACKAPLDTRNLGIKIRSITAEAFIDPEAKRIFCLPSDCSKDDKRYFPKININDLQNQLAQLSEEQIINIYSYDAIKLYEIQERLERGSVIVKSPYLIQFLKKAKEQEFLDQEKLDSIMATFGEVNKATKKSVQLEISFQGGKIVDLKCFNKNHKLAFRDMFEHIIGSESVINGEKNLELLCQKRACDESYQFLKFYFARKNMIISQHQFQKEELLRLADENKIAALSDNNQRAALIALLGKLKDAPTLFYLFNKFMPIECDEDASLSTPINILNEGKNELLESLLLYNNDIFKKCLELVVLDVVKLLVGNNILNEYMDYLKRKFNEQ